MGEKLRRSVTTTEDGTVIIVDPELGQAVSGRTLAEAEAEVRRLKASTCDAGPERNELGYTADEWDRLMREPFPISHDEGKILFVSAPCKHFSKAG